MLFAETVTPLPVVTVDSGLSITHARQVNQNITHHNEHSARKPLRAAAMFLAEARAQQRSERLVDSRQNLQNK